ncbi:MAG: peptidase S41 [Gammaproteobacteria bacterium]|nr:peptidase S41 [Gammaproteobacteria bacterium]
METPSAPPTKNVVCSLIIALLVSACGGGGGGGGGNTSGGGGATGSACSLANRQNWVVSQMNEWYLYPETLPQSINIANYNSIDALISAMIATAKLQNKDRDFTYITSIAQENALINSGSTAGFGILLYYDLTARRVFILEAYETAPAYSTAGIDRGDEIIEIGTSANDLRKVSDILAAEGRQGVSNALGPSTAGLTRVLRIARGSTVRNVTVSKADYSLEPLSPRHGARIIDEGGKRYGYINLRTFIVDSASTRLKEEFAKFRSAGITEVVIDFRYNGGGLVRVAQTMGDLLGGNRQTSETFSETVYRSSKSSQNSLKQFSPQPESISPIKLAFITTSSSASASELVINSFIPYLNDRLALIGGNTFGKPVGQIAADNAACDDRLRVLAFTTRNSAGSDAYFNGLAEAVKASCRANDDFSQALGSASEGSTRQALDWLQGRACTPIPATTAQAAEASNIGQRTTISKDADLQLEPVPVSGRPTPAQREIPGLF